MQTPTMTSRPTPRLKQPRQLVCARVKIGVGERLSVKLYRRGAGTKLGLHFQ